MCVLLLRRGGRGRAHACIALRLWGACLTSGGGGGRCARAVAHAHTQNDRLTTPRREKLDEVDLAVADLLLCCVHQGERREK